MTNKQTVAVFIVLFVVTTGILISLPAHDSIMYNVYDFMEFIFSAHILYMVYRLYNAPDKHTDS